MSMDDIELPGNLIQTSENLGPALRVVACRLGGHDFGPIAVIRKEARTERAVQVFTERGAGGLRNVDRDNHVARIQNTSAKTIRGRDDAVAVAVGHDADVRLIAALVHALKARR